MSAEAAYDQLIARVRDCSTLGSCGAVLGWDERTFMPAAAAAHRGAQMAILARIGHELFTNPKVGELLGQLDEKTLPEDRSANVREIRRAYSRATRLPNELVEALARVTSQAQGVWQEAKAKNDFKLFQPWLEKIVALKRREADCVGFAESPYDALFDEFEPGGTAASVRSLFAKLAAELSPLVKLIADRMPAVKSELFAGEFPVAAQEALSRQVAVDIGFEFEKGRLDTTAHPFCTGIGPGDCRILTRYHAERPFESFFGTLHEAGHGLYEQGLPADHFGTPLGVAASFGIHESQSRMWENQVGRSRAFWEGYLPRFQRAFAPKWGSATVDDVWLAVNQVRPSFIRIDADEVTYNLHIILRFELEVSLLDGSLPVGDLPGAWNERFQAFFGLTPPSDAMGCLQDIHWSFGGIGYFPTYTLGNLYAAQFAEAATARMPLDDQIRCGDFAPLTSWLRDNIHRHGQRYRPAELCGRITGRPLSHEPFIAYLKQKFRDWAA